MQHHRWSWLPIGLVTAGVLAVCSATVANHAQLGWWQALVYAGCALALAATFLFRRKLSATEIELERLRARVADEQNRLASDRSQFEELRLTMQNELAQQAHRIDKREQALADRLVTYHEWMEFPQPIELTQHPEASASRADLARKDRQMLELLQAETKVLYDNIVQNKYAAEGRVLLPMIRDDVLVLIQRVAKIYQPNVEQPLLEASLDRVFRAVSRASLHLLVILDELPLSVDEASFNTIYNYVRSAVNTWRMYKSAETYWPYVNTAYYLSRFALGANPLALGTWWFVSSLGSRGAQAIAQHVVNRQALALLSDVVRVIGFEVAGIYGGNFRHRDANWVYAAELTELVSTFPLSRDSLAHALRDVGTLQLRSEYDRTFVYRCLADGKSAQPEQYHAADVLTMDERRAVATRIEKFLGAFIHGKSADRVSRWKAGAEQRLGIKLSVSFKESSASVKDQILDAMRSLASFVVALKQLEPPATIPWIAKTSVAGKLTAGEREAVLRDLAQHASYFFEHADLDPDGELVDPYLDDLASLHARMSPRAAVIEETLEDVAAYLRRSPKKMQALIEKHYAASLAEKLPTDAPLKKVPAPAARAALDLLLDPAEPARFLYGPANLEWPDGNRHEPFDDGTLWLLGLGQRMILFAVGLQPRVIWRGARDNVHAEQVRQVFMSACRLTGGQWQLEGQAQPLAIRVPTGLLSAYGSYFKPLLALLGIEQQAVAAG
jgi:hypothetical protein